MKLKPSKEEADLKKASKDFRNENLFIHKELIDYAELGNQNAPIRFLIAFKNRKGKLATCILSSGDLISVRVTQTILVQNGFPMMTYKEFYSHYESLMVKYALPRGYTTQTPGWHLIDGKQHYVYPQENHTLPIIYLPSNSVKLGANLQVGNLEDWQELIKICAQSSRLRLMAAMAFLPLFFDLLMSHHMGYLYMEKQVVVKHLVNFLQHQLLEIL